MNHLVSVLLTFAAGAALAAGGPSEHARAADGAMIVLDASGSMAGYIGGRPKIEIARDTLATVLADPPEKLALGLLVYGHRQRASCTDIDLMVPPAIGSTRAILDAAAAVKPLGKTPLADSISAAAQELNYEEQKATVIVVTDGADNCSGDPCALASDLKDTGADFTIHVIGFGLTESDKRSVACLADVTGGLYLDAADASELSAALTKAVKVEPEIPLPAASLTAPDSVEQASEFAVAYSGPKEEGDQIQIAWPGSRPGQFIRNVRVGDDGRPARFTAPAESGDYELRYWLPSRGKIIAQAAIKVIEAEVRLSAPQSVGQGEEFAVAWTGRADPNGVIDIVPRDGGAPISGARVRAFSSPVKLDAPAVPGAYVVRYRIADETRTTLPISVTPSRVGFDAPSNVSGGADFNVGWTGPAGYYDEIQLASPETPNGSRIEYARVPEAGELVVLTAPLQAGSYELRYWSSRSKAVLARQAVQVFAAAASVGGSSGIEGGAPVTVTWTGPTARFDEIQIARAGAAPGDAVSRADPGPGGRPVTLPAPVEPGNYEIRYWSGAWRAMLARQSVVVTAPTASLSVASGPIVIAGSRFAVGWSGPAGRYDDIRIAQPDGAPDDAIHAARLGKPGETVELLAPQQPGSYELRYWSDSARRVLATLPITVQ